MIDFGVFEIQCLRVQGNNDLFKTVNCAESLVFQFTIQKCKD